MIVEYTGREGSVLTNTLMLRSKTMIDKDKHDMIYNEIGNYDNTFQPVSFEGSS